MEQTQAQGDPLEAQDSGGNPNHHTATVHRSGSKQLPRVPAPSRIQSPQAFYRIQNPKAPLQFKSHGPHPSAPVQPLRLGLGHLELNFNQSS